MGKVRAGYTRDLIVVNGNPVEDLKVLYPTGIETWVNGKPVHGGGVEWTIKDGIPYHAPTMLSDVKEMVAKARAQKGTNGGCKKAPRVGRRAPVLLVLCAATRSQNWPSFRGPGAFGVVELASTPRHGTSKKAATSRGSSMCRAFRIRVRSCGAIAFTL